ncbi:hypothetical protein HDU97_010394 [Phlyctochytrium planicorne]|nr:hypothetical protein HDU97_010394 [Phlyctochytrium planicorne]
MSGQKRKWKDDIPYALPKPPTSSLRAYDQIKSLMNFIGVVDSDATESLLVELTAFQDRFRTEASTSTFSNSSQLKQTWDNTLGLLDQVYCIDASQASSKWEETNIFAPIQPDISQVRVDSDSAAAILFSALRALGCMLTLGKVLEQATFDGEGHDGQSSESVQLSLSTNSPNSHHTKRLKGDSDIIFKRMAGLDVLAYPSPRQHHQPEFFQERAAPIEIVWGAAGILGWKLGKNGRMEALHSEIEDVVRIPLFQTPLRMGSNDGFLDHLEDSFPIFVLADGHGGRQAAHWFVDRVPQILHKTFQEWCLNETIQCEHDVEKAFERKECRETIKNSIQKAIHDLDVEFCKKRRQELESADGDLVPDDGSTLSIVGILPGAKFALVCHVGDSRVAFAGTEVTTIVSTLSESTPEIVSPRLAKTPSVGEDSGSGPMTPRKDDGRPPRTPRSTKRQRVVETTPTRNGFRNVLNFTGDGYRFSNQKSLTHLLHVTSDHAVHHSRKATSCHRRGAVFRKSRTSSVIEGIDFGRWLASGSEVTDQSIPELTEARIFRRDSFALPWIKSETQPIIKSLAMSDSMGDIVMKLDPPIFEALPDVDFIRLFPTPLEASQGGADSKLQPKPSVSILLASDGIWNYLSSEDTHSSLRGGSEVLRVMERVQQSLRPQPIEFFTATTPSSTWTGTPSLTPTRRSPRSQPLKECSTTRSGMKWSADDVARSIVSAVGPTSSSVSPLHAGVGCDISCQNVAEWLCARDSGAWRDLFRPIDMSRDSYVDDCSAIVICVRQVGASFWTDGGTPVSEELNGEVIQGLRAPNADALLRDVQDSDSVVVVDEESRVGPFKCFVVEDSQPPPILVVEDSQPPLSDHVCTPSMAKSDAESAVLEDSQPSPHLRVRFLDDGTKDVEVVMVESQDSVECIEDDGSLSQRSFLQVPDSCPSPIL